MLPVISFVPESTGMTSARVNPLATPVISKLVVVVNPYVLLNVLEIPDSDSIIGDRVTFAAFVVVAWTPVIWNVSGTGVSPYEANEAEPVIENAKTLREWRCDICGITMPQGNRATHVNGKKHMKNCEAVEFIAQQQEKKEEQNET